LNNIKSCKIGFNIVMFYQEQQFIDGLIQLIQECNKIVLDIYHTDFEVVSKSDDSPLTMADKKCNEHICNFLKEKYSHIMIVSEENKEISYEERKKHALSWLIDPIDGTKEFVKRNGQFTINIGLCRDGVPIFGIVTIPVTGEIYYGIEGVGSFKIINSEKSKLQIAKKDFTKEGLKIVASLSHLNKETEGFIGQFKNPITLNTGSSIKLLWVAEGKADIYPRLAPTSEWDTCAAHAVVKYAGGNVVKHNTDWMRNAEELVYNKENVLNPHFIVY